MSASGQKRTFNICDVRVPSQSFYCIERMNSPVVASLTIIVPEATDGFIIFVIDEQV